MTLLALLTVLSPSASAFCGTYVGQADSGLYNHASQVAIVRQGTRTTLNLAMDYAGDLTQFAVVIPVPVVLGPDDVKLLDPALFQTMDAYSGPRLVSYSCDDFNGDSGWGGGGGAGGCLGCVGPAEHPMARDGAADGGAVEAEPAVTVEASFTEGEYEIVVLSAEESAGLYIWLADNGYALPSGGEAILDEYIAAGSYFFAAKVTLEAAEGGTQGLSPIQFTYDSDVFSLPVRIGTISSDGEQDVIVYGITSIADGKIAIANYPEVTLEDECMFEDDGTGFGEFYLDRVAEAQAVESRPGWITEYAWSSGSCDPCSGNPPDDGQLADLGFTGTGYDMQFTRLHLRYGPNDVDQDLTLYTSGIADQQQVKYIVYNPDLEDLFPVCGEGMVEDPGTCDGEADSKSVPRGAGSLPLLPIAVLAAAGAALATRRRS